MPTTLADQFRPMPFYFLNTTDPAAYTVEEVRKSVARLKDLGYGGLVLFNKPPDGFDEELYLSDFWFEVTRLFAEAARDAGLRLWINDGHNYPPGDAGGRILKRRQDLQQFRLRPDPEGNLIPVEVPWGYPAFEHPASSELFIELVYEEYARRLGGYFGNGITGFFSDADNRRCNFATSRDLQGERYYPWSRDFPERFAARFGYDITARLKGLFRGDDPEVVHDYWQFCGELYQQWFANNGKWCREHGLLYTFHSSDTGPLNWHRCYRSSAFTEGDVFSLLSHSDFPGTDHEIQVLDGGTHYDDRLFYPCVTLGGGREKLDHPRFADTSRDIRAKYAGSAAYLSGRPGAMCEMFAATNWGTDFNQLSRIAAWQVMQGVTFIVPHAVHHRLHGETKFFAPPEFSRTNLAAGARAFHDRLALWCMAASSGKYLVDLAVIDPTAEVWQGLDSTVFFQFCDRLNRRGCGYVIVPRREAGRFDCVADPVQGRIPELPPARAGFTGGDLAYMPRELNGEKYLLAANIWSDDVLQGTLTFEDRSVELELAPGEIAIVGGPWESFRKPVQKQVLQTFCELPVAFAGKNVIPFREKLEVDLAEEMTLLLQSPAGSGAPLVDGAAPAGGEEILLYDDLYIQWPVTLSPGKHVLTAPEGVTFETPCLLAGEFDMDLHTVNDYHHTVKTTYMLEIMEPEKWSCTLTTRRKKLDTLCGWEKQGQLFYSGEAVYDLGVVDLPEKSFLALPGFTGTAELVIDGTAAARKSFAPYTCELPAGSHHLQLRCWNSMANRFERYAAPSGLTRPPEICR